MLVDWWEFDRAKRPASPRQADRSRDKLVDKAVRYAERFCFSKAVRLLTSNGVADSADPRIQAQMDAKFPDRKSPMPGSLDNFAPFQPYTSIEMEHYPRKSLFNTNSNLHRGGRQITAQRCGFGPRWHETGVFPCP